MSNDIDSRDGRVAVEDVRRWLEQLTRGPNAADFARMLGDAGPGYVASDLVVHRPIAPWVETAIVKARSDGSVDYVALVPREGAAPVLAELESVFGSSHEAPALYPGPVTHIFDHWLEGQLLRVFAEPASGGGSRPSVGRLLLSYLGHVS